MHVFAICHWKFCGWNVRVPDGSHAAVHHTPHPRDDEFAQSPATLLL